MRFFFVIISFLFISTSCKNNKSAILPEVKNISESVYASGIVKSYGQYQVFSKVNGTLQKVFVEKGSIVKKDDLLFEISNGNARLNTENALLAAENADYTANLSRLDDLKLSVDQAKKKLENDSLLWIRQSNLWDKNIGTKIELEQRELMYNNSKTALASAILKYEDLQRQLKFSSSQSKNNLQISKTLENDFTIKSEMDGRVYDIYKEKGELVTSQMPIAVIGNADNFKIELQVDENDIVNIRKDQQLILHFDSYKGETYEAKIAEIDPMMDERTRTFTVDAAFTKKPDVLYPNLTAEANIIIRTKLNGLTIPRNYLFQDSLVLLEDGTKQKVKTGLKDYKTVEILEGINRLTKIVLPEK